MSQTRIEITAEAAQAEATYERLTRAQDEQEAGQRSLETTANQVSAKVVDGYQQMLDAAGLVVDANGKLVDSAGNYATAAQAAAVRAAAGFEESATQIEAANEAAASKSAYAYNQILRELRRQGPEGRAQAKAVEEYLREAGLAGRRSMESITEELQELDPAAAAAAVAIKTDMGSAAEQSATKLQGIARELEKLGPEGKAQADAIRGYLRRTGQDGVRSMGDISDEISKIDPEAARVAKKAGDDFERAGDKAQSAFGEGIRGELASMATSYISLNAAAQTYLSTIERARDAARESVQTMLETVDGNRKLLQVAEDGDDFEALTGRADQLAGTYGISRENARDLVFSARSEGFESSLDQIASNAGNQVVTTTAQATAAGQVPGLFASTGENITPEQAIDAILVGAQASRANFEQLTAALPTVAASAAPTNGGFNESLASLSVLTGSFKSPEQAAERIAAFASALNLDKGGEGRESVADRGLLEGFRAIRDNFTDEQRDQFLGGNKELNEAYAAIEANYDTIAARTGEIDQARSRSGTGDSESARRRAIAERSDKIVAAREKLAADNRLEIEREGRRGAAEAGRQTDRANELAEAETRGVDTRRIAAAELAQEQADKVFGENSTSAIGLYTGNQLDQLIRDLGLATDREGADPTAEAALLAATQLRKRRQADGADAILSAGDVSNYLLGTTGQSISPANISEEQRRELTDAIASGATQTRGFGRTMSASFLNLLPNVARQNSLAFASAAGEGSELAQGINREFLDVQKQLLEELRQNTAATRDAANASKKTAQNTEKETPDYTAEIDDELDRRIPDPI